MAADLTTYDKDLKDNYGPAIEMQLNSKRPLLKRVKKDDGSLEGRQFIVPLQGRRTEGVGSRGGLSATLPTAGEMTLDNATWKPNYHWGQIQISKVIIEHTKKTSGAWTKAVTAETKSLADTMALDLNRQCFNDGTGLISRTGVTTAALVLVLATTGLYRALGNGRLRVGMYVDILTRSTGVAIANGAARKIVSVNKAANTVTLDTPGGNVTTTANEGVYRAGNKLLTVNNEMPGLRNIIAAAGAIGGVDPAVAGQEYWSANVVTGAAPGTPEVITEVRMQKVVDQVDELSNGDTSALYSHHNVRRAYFNLLVSLKRFVKPMTLDGGFDALEFNGMPFMVDQDCEPNGIYFPDESHLKWYTLTSPAWLDDDGSILKWDQGTGFKAIYHWFATFATDARNAHGKLEDVTEA